MSPTPPNVVKDTRGSAELLEKIVVNHQSQTFRVELVGETGEGAAATLTPPELQRILLMLQSEVAKAKWIAANMASPATSAPQENQPARH